MQKKAFTLMELIIVVVIVGTLSGLALPRIFNAIEMRKIETAKIQIRLIAAALDIAQTNNKSYVPCVGETGPESCDTTEKINQRLELDIHNNDFGFRVLAIGIGNEYQIVTADRVGGSENYSLILTPGALDIVCYGACDRYLEGPEI